MEVMTINLLEAIGGASVLHEHKSVGVQAVRYHFAVSTKLLVLLNEQNPAPAIEFFSEAVHDDAGLSLLRKGAWLISRTYDEGVTKWRFKSPTRPMDDGCVWFAQYEGESSVAAKLPLSRENYNFVPMSCVVAYDKIQIFKTNLVGCLQLGCERNAAHLFCLDYQRSRPVCNVLEYQN